MEPVYTGMSPPVWRLACAVEVKTGAVSENRTGHWRLKTAPGFGAPLLNKAHIGYVRGGLAVG